MQRTHIAIIGGGLVGASLALCLQRGARSRNWRITLVEPFSPGDSYQPSYDARCSALSYGTRLIYQQLGVWGSISSRAEPISDINVSELGSNAKVDLHAAEEGVPALGYVVENAWLGRCLWDALDRDAVDWRCPAEVERLEVLRDGYRLHFANGETLEADLCVLADGGRSPLRSQLGVGVSCKPYGQTALVANVTSEKPHDGRAFERFTPSGPIALLPLAENRCALVWTRPDEEARRLRQAGEEGFLRELAQSFGDRLGHFQQVGERHLYPLQLVQATEQVRPGLVLLGNSAHSLHPIAGQGYNLSLRDAKALADCLLESKAPLGDLQTLQRYVDGQRGDQWMTIGFSDQVIRLFSNRQPLLMLGRSLGLRAMDWIPPARHWFARRAMGLGTRSF